MSATVLSCCRASQWPSALELLTSTSIAPTSHALAAVLSEVEAVPEVEATWALEFGCFELWDPTKWGKLGHEVLNIINIRTEKVLTFGKGSLS